MTDDQLLQRVRKLLLKNVRDGYSGLLGQSYCYIAPSPRPYPFQWFWDTCFHVVMLARLGEYELAQKNLRGLFAMQRADGFVGHMIFWRQVLPVRPSDVLQARLSWQSLRPHMSALIQPPFAAIALHTLFEESRDRVYLGEMYARVKRHHDWLARMRDFDGDGLLTIISPFESGMDWKPSYDPVLGHRERRTPRRLYTSRLYWTAMAVDFDNFARRYDVSKIRRRGRFLVKDAGINAIYALDLLCMERLAPIVGDDPAIYRTRRTQVLASMLRLMYDEEDAAFYDVQKPGSKKLRIRTPTIFFPLAIPELDQTIAERVIAAHFNNAEEFASPFRLPSVALHDPGFYPGHTPFIWRGPMWAVNNWFIYHALRHRGFAEQAEALRRSLWTAIDKSGFREYYDPITGEGHGAQDFTWSGLAIDMRHDHDADRVMANLEGSPPKQQGESPMIRRTTREVLDDHLALAQQGDLETDIVRNFDPKCVLMTTYGNFCGHAGVREAAHLLERQIGRSGYNYLREECHDQLAFLEWTADTERAEVPDGADSYWIRDGKILAMTIHYSVHEKRD